MAKYDKKRKLELEDNENKNKKSKSDDIDDLNGKLYLFYVISLLINTNFFYILIKLQ